MAAHQGMLGSAVMVFHPLTPALNVDAVTPTLLSQIDPTTTVSNWVRPLIRISGRPARPDDTLDPSAGPRGFRSRCTKRFVTSPPTQCWPV